MAVNPPTPPQLEGEEPIQEAEPTDRPPEESLDDEESAPPPLVNDESVPIREDGDTTQMRSGRMTRAPAWAQDYVVYSSDVSDYYATRVEHEFLNPSIYLEQETLQELDDPIAFAMKASSDPDTLYYNEAMNQPDRENFKEAMVKEVNAHTEQKHWIIVERCTVPESETVLLAVWAMKCKRRIATQEVYKWKSRINLGGHKMVYGKHYEETYAPALT